MFPYDASLGVSLHYTYTTAPSSLSIKPPAKFAREGVRYNTLFVYDGNSMTQCSPGVYDSIHESLPSHDALLPLYGVHVVVAREVLARGLSAPCEPIPRVFPAVVDAGQDRVHVVHRLAIQKKGNKGNTVRYKKAPDGVTIRKG